MDFHCPLLVECVEKLDSRANDENSSLSIHKLKGRRHIIDDYDGSETVIEPEHVKWIEVS